jgi:hypothetical protein
MTLDQSRRLVRDASGETWVAWESLMGMMAVSGWHAVKPSPWVTFTNEESGLRLSGFSAAHLGDLTDAQLTRLLEEMLRRERR